MLHVLQRIEALRNPEAGERFKLLGGRATQIVSSLKLEYPADSRRAERSRWLERLFLSYDEVKSRWETSTFHLQKALKRLRDKSKEFAVQLKSFDTEKAPEHGLGKEVESIERDLEELVQAIEQDPKLEKEDADFIRRLARQDIEALRAYAEYPIEAMAETPFDYGRAEEVFERFFKRGK